MDVLTGHPLIEVTPKEIEKVRQCLNVDKAQIDKNLDAIEEWAKKENHLSEAFKYLDRKSLERLLIAQKGSLEKTKNRIERLLTTRGMLPELSQNISIDEFDEFSRNMHYLALPKLHPGDLTRIKITRLVNEKGNDTNLLTFFRFVHLIIDYTLNIDYNLGERHIVDLKHFNMTGFSKLNPFILKKAEVLSMEGYGLRMKGIHVVNAPSFVDQVVALAKKAFKEKLANRIYVHKSIEDLHKQIPKGVLPEEYGGDLKSCSVLNEQWMTTLRTSEARNIIEKTNKLYADESKRSCYKFNSEYLGMPGSFSQLEVD